MNFRFRGNFVAIVGVASAVRSQCRPLQTVHSPRTSFEITDKNQQQQFGGGGDRDELLSPALPCICPQSSLLAVITSKHGVRGESSRDLSASVIGRTKFLREPIYGSNSRQSNSTHSIRRRQDVCKYYCRPKWAKEKCRGRRQWRVDRTRTSKRTARQVRSEDPSRDRFCEFREPPRNPRMEF